MRPQVQGIITERLFEEGSTVEKGAQLYQIDDTRYKAALESAKADLASAQASVKTAQAKASVGVAQASVDMAQINLDYTKVYAPISGRIGRSLFTVGALVTAGQTSPLAVITAVDPVYVDIQQSGEKALAVQDMIAQKKTVPVSLTIHGAEDRTYPEKGTLEFSEITIDETTGAVTMRAKMPNSNGILMAGLFVRAHLALGGSQKLLVSQRAVTRTPDGGAIVKVVADGNKVASKKVMLGDAYQGSWIVESGLNAGDKVITAGYQKVQDGQVVTPQAEDNTAQSPDDSAKDAGASSGQ